MSSVPYTFTAQAGPIPLNELDANFANVKAFADTAGYVTANAQSNITSVGTLTSLSVTGNIYGSKIFANIVGNVDAAGNVTEIQFNSTGDQLGASANFTFDKDTNVMTVLDGNIIANDITGNITIPGGGRIFNNGHVTPTVDIVGSNYVQMQSGNTYIWANSAGANIQAGGNRWYFNNSGQLNCPGNISAAGNITGSNLVSNGYISASGNVYANNIIANNSIPTGGIIMWSGSIASIPAGWYLCDGSNSTPDLRDRFVVGAGSTYAVAATGGSANAIVVSHTHTATSTDSGHTHAEQFSGGTAGTGNGICDSVVSAVTTSSVYTATGNANITTTVNSTGSSGTNANLPPYYALAYIMKS